MRLVVPVLVIGLLALAGCASAPNGVGAIVLVSGRDDHGLVVEPHVALYAEPNSTQATGRVPDGSFARVLEIHGTWLRVESLGEAAVSGWVDDFYLRDRAVLDGRAQVRLLGGRDTGGRVEISVQPVADPSAEPTWAPASDLREVLAPSDDS